MPMDRKLGPDPPHRFHALGFAEKLTLHVKLRLGRKTPSNRICMERLFPLNALALPDGTEGSYSRNKTASSLRTIVPPPRARRRVAKSFVGRGCAKTVDLELDAV